MEEELSRAAAHADAALRAVFDEKLYYQYPHADLEGLTVKTTVSELKKASYEETAAESAELIVLPRESYIPDFAQEDMQDMTEVSESEETARARSGIQYGTAVHKIMELLSFTEKFRTDNKKLYADIKKRAGTMDCRGNRHSGGTCLCRRAQDSGLFPVQTLTADDCGKQAL